MKSTWVSITSTSFVILLIASTLNAQNPSDPTVNPLDPAAVNGMVGQWKNQLGSTLTIKAIDIQTGAIAGSYKSGSGTGGQDFPLVGWVNVIPEDPKLPNHVVVISFSVRWGQIGSITTWNGYYATKQNPELVGQWLLSRPNSNYIWDHIVAGQDQFEHTSP